MIKMYGLYGSRFVFSVLFAFGFLLNVRGGTLRPPSVPLVACDPYFSIWSPADKLTDTDTTHWTGKPQRLTSLVRIDGKVFRIMGATPASAPALTQSDLQILPTRTIYTFAGQGIRLTLTFMTAGLPGDVNLLSRPVTYLTWQAESTDGQDHTVSVYFDASSEVAVNENQQAVNFQNADTGRLKAWSVGTVDQPVLAKKGDDVRIDWGYFYVATPKEKDAELTANVTGVSRNSFADSGHLPPPAATSSLEHNNRNDTVIAFADDLGTVREKAVSCHLILAYDDLYSIQYMKRNLRPYWRRNGWEAADLLKAAAHD
ncbi:MAG TPA: DUF5127 domain-containing protein, partial [Verrucomicrobiae bacterium]